jgi:hypothetical protein
MSSPLVLQPDATAGIDNWIQNVNPDTNYGTNATMYLGAAGAGSNINRDLLKFDISGIPAGATITSAILSLWLYENTSASNARIARVYRLKLAFNESQSTWNSRSTGNSWNSAGAFGVADCEQTDIGSLSIAAAEGLGEKQWSLTPAKVQEWFVGTFTNNGILVKMDTENTDLHAFRSSDYATAGERPKLVIAYTLPGGAHGQAIIIP